MDVRHKGLVYKSIGELEAPFEIKQVLRKIAQKYIGNQLNIREYLEDKLIRYLEDMDGPALEKLISLH